MHPFNFFWSIFLYYLHVDSICDQHVWVEKLSTLFRDKTETDSHTKYMAQRRRARARTLGCRRRAPGAAHLAPTTHPPSMASNNPRGGSMGLQGPPYAVPSPLVADPLDPPGDPESSLFLTCHFVRKGRRCGKRQNGQNRHGLLI